MESETERFWGKTIPEPNTGCWLWMGTTLRNGYGQFKSGGRRWLAHRFAWTAERFPIPDGMEVRHFVCANPACVNVRHLRLGTAKDNAGDRARDGHTVQGARVTGARLDEVDVLCIRTLYASGKVSAAELGRRWGVTRQTVWQLVSGKTWRAA